MPPLIQQLEQDPRYFRWGVNTIPLFNKGLNTYTPDEELDDQFARVFLNVRFDDDRVLVDTGFKNLGDTVRGTPRQAYEHETVSGVRTLLLVTNSTVYRYSLADDAWHYISDGTSTTLTAAASSPDTTLTVASIAGFSDGDFIAVVLDSGDQHKTTVNGAPAGSTITITDPMPGNAGIGNTVLKAKDLNGIDSEQVVIDAVPFEGWTVFTNGIDPPQRYDGATVEDIPNLPSGGDTVCKALVTFRDYLLLLNMIEGGVAFPYNVRWCDNGDGENWSSGDAGTAPLTETRDPIQGGKLLGRQLMIYHTRSITRTQFLTEGPSPFLFEGVSFGQSAQAQGISALSHNAVFALEDSHIFPTRKGIYLYPGGQTVSRISDVILNETSSGVDTNQALAAFTQSSDRRDWLMFFLPTQGKTFPDIAYILDRGRRAWTTRQFSALPKQISFAAIRTGKAGVRYVDLVGAMGAQTWSALTLSSGEESPTILLGDGKANKVYEYDYVQSNDIDSPFGIGAFIRSKKYRSFNRRARIQWVEIELASGSCYILISDGGSRSITALNKVTNSSPTFRKYRATVDEEWDTFHFHIALEGSGTSVRNLSFKLRPGSRLEF